MTTPLILQVSANNSNALKAWHSFSYPDSVTQSGTVTNLVDLSGNGLDLDTGNAPAYTTDGANLQPGAIYDGVDDYLETTGTLDFSTNNAATIFIAFRYVGNPKSNSSAQVIVSQDDTDTSTIFRITTGLRYRFDGFGTNFDSYRDADNETHVIALRASSSAGTKELFIDGVFDRSGSITWANGSGKIGLGRNIFASSLPFEGVVLEDAWFNVALTDDEIVAISRDMGNRFNTPVYAVPTDANFHYDFNSSRAVTLNGADISDIEDQGSAGVDLTQATASAQPLQGVGRMNGRNCSIYDNTNNTLLGNAGNGTTSTSFTICIAACQNREGTASNYMTNFTSSPTRGFQLRKNGSDEVTLRVDNGSGTWTSIESSTLSADDFKVPHVVIATFDGTNGVVYFNNTQVASGTGSISYSSPDIQIGATNFAGGIGEFILFERVLSAEEIDQVHGYLSEKWVNPLVDLDLNYMYDVSKPKTLTFNGGDVSDINNIEATTTGTTTYDLSQGTASKQPTFDGSGLKNHASIITTDASAEGFTLSSGTLQQPANVTIYVVSKENNANSKFRLFVQNYGSNQGYRLGMNTSNRVWFTIGATSGTSTFAPTTISTADLSVPYVLCARYDGVAQLINFRNGSSDISAAQAAVNGDLIYSSPNNTLFNEGDVDADTSFIAVHGVAHDDATVETNMNYLLRQFNIG